MYRVYCTESVPNKRNTTLVDLVYLPSSSHPRRSNPYINHDGGGFRPKTHSLVRTSASYAPASSSAETWWSRAVRTTTSGSGMRITTAFAAAMSTCFFCMGFRQAIVRRMLGMSNNTLRFERSRGAWAVKAGRKAVRRHFCPACAISRHSWKHSMLKNGLID